MGRQQRKLTHFGAPVAFLLAVTIVVLILHGGFGGTTSKRSSTQSSSNTTTTKAATTSHVTVKKQVYVIRSGDTLGAIAIHFGITVDDILALNRGINPTALRVGQKIYVRARKTK
ncbi:MAG: LysM domain-containing protein [Gaiellaceae bacterium]|jgi:LysM repeat protein